MYGIVMWNRWVFESELLCQTNVVVVGSGIQMSVK